MKIIVFGGDGFCGWPTSLGLSKDGHDIVIVDNLSRRLIDDKLNISSLTPISSIEERLKAWVSVSGNQIKFHNFDIAEEYNELNKLLNEYQPDAVIQFAEQRAAPYSMKSPDTKRYTVDNNIASTHNILVSLVANKLDCHFIHLGSMGVYGYGTADMKIPEGYLDILLETESGLKNKTILYPSSPGSVYHMTKSMEQIMFGFYVKNDNLQITDLHQGVVWGTQTDETSLDERLINRFDYDGDYGTVLNRFLMQSAIDYPLTVHGTGGQTRAFIHIMDTINCIRLAIENSSSKKDSVTIRNQMTETHKVYDLAKMISDLNGSEIQFLENPRNEDSENELNVNNNSFLNEGLNPIKLNTGLATEIYDIAKKYSHRCDLTKIQCTSRW